MRNHAPAFTMAAVMLMTGCGGCSNSGAVSLGAPATQTESGTSAEPTSAAPSASESAASASAEPSPPADSEQEALRSAAQRYSDAYLTGDAKTAYSILSERCRDRLSRSEFAAMVDVAESMYGSALPFESFSAKISGDMARVTYTFSVKAINQTAEPWVKEGSDWHEDDC